jgi:hypothetical protein
LKRMPSFGSLAKSITCVLGSTGSRTAETCQCSSGATVS